MVKINLVTDTGPCNLDLRKSCIIIASFFLAITVIGVIFHPSYLGTAATIFGFVVLLVGNLALLIGSLREYPWLVLVWLINAILFFIGWPIAVLGVIFNFGGYRQVSMFQNIFLILLEYIIDLVFYLFVTRLVYSFFRQLRNNQSNPQHAVVV